MSISADDNLELYARVESYAWGNDAEFQEGLCAIIGSNSTPEQAVELGLRARCFYYTRKFNTNVDFDEYKAYRTRHNLPPPTLPNPSIAEPFTFEPGSITSLSGISQPGGPALTPTAVTPSEPASKTSPPTTNSSQQEAPYPTSFAHIVELITSGKPIPGIKEIPKTILEGQGTKSAQTTRKKPWEKEVAVDASNS